MPDQAKVIALHFGRLQEVVHARRELFAKVPAGTSLETVLEPTYWKHYTRDIRALDIIEVFCEDGSWEASLRVMFVATNEVRVKLRSHVPLDDDVETAEEPTETYKTKWKGPALKWAVVHADTGEVIESGFEKEEAIKALHRHVENMKA